MDNSIGTVTKMAESDKELKAIGNIIKELEGISKERRETALKMVVDFLGIGISSVKPQDQKPPLTVGVSSQGAPMDSIKNFIDHKNPINNYQLIACLAYYLEKKQNIKAVGAKEIRDANAEARRPSISNIPRDLTDATRKFGYLTKASTDKRKKMLTSQGEKVVDLLPNQEDVKNLPKITHTRRNKRKKAA